MEKKKLVIAILGYGLLFGCNTAKQTWGVRDSDLHTPQATELITHDPDRGEAVDPFTVITNEGYRVYFVHTNGEWMAQVTENLPAGFSNVVTLPIHCGVGFSVEDLAKITPLLQKQYLYVNLRSSSSDTMRHVYIGAVGLQGGGPSASSLRGADPLSNYMNIPELSLFPSNLEIRQAIATIAEGCAGHSIARDLWLVDKKRYGILKDKPKCNLFVAEVIANVGFASWASRNGSIRGLTPIMPTLTFQIPTAKQWFEDSVWGWDLIGRHQVELGDIAAQRKEYRNPTGHVAIVTGYQTTTSSAILYCGGHPENGRVVSNDWGFRPENQPGQEYEVRFLRYKGSVDQIMNPLLGTL